MSQGAGHWTKDNSEALGKWEVTDRGSCKGRARADPAWGQWLPRTPGLRCSCVGDRKQPPGARSHPVLTLHAPPCPAGGFRKCGGNLAQRQPQRGPGRSFTPLFSRCLSCTCRGQAMFWTLRTRGQFQLLAVVCVCARVCSPAPWRGSGEMHSKQLQNTPAVTTPFFSHMLEALLCPQMTSGPHLTLVRVHVARTTSGFHPQSYTQEINPARPGRAESSPLPSPSCR